MSKGGGAGKVYFVLYLAVVLELLIIIVERDEAEEGLHKKQKETMKIVESILSQLQSGAGTEGINTRPQDEITIPPPGVNIKEVLGADIKSSRKYIVEVGVTDISAAIKQKEGESGKEYQQRLRKLVELANVEEIEYQIFYNTSQEVTNAPFFPSDETIAKEKWDFTKFTPGQTIKGPDESEWEFIGDRKLVLDKEQTFTNLNLENLSPESITPFYPRGMEVVVGASCAPPNMPEDSIFYYSNTESIARLSGRSSGNLKKRAFVVNFQPPSKAGWYKLRFASRTNRILGVRSDMKFAELNDETTVNIGTVSLTVKDLLKVQKELASKLEKFNLPSLEQLVKDGDLQAFEDKLKAAQEVAKQSEDAVEIVGKIDLFGYIAKLLAPGQSINFDQNRGAIEFNVRVILPQVKIANPEIVATKYIPCFDKLQPVFQFTVSPYQGNNSVSGEVKKDGATVARIECRPLDEIADAGGTAPQQGGKREYRGIISQTLPPGKYEIEIRHTLPGSQKPATIISDLEIFKTKLTEDSERKINGQLSAFSYYGYPVTIDAIPESGGKIPADQFRIYLRTDKDQQRNPIQGLSVTHDMNFKLLPEANNVNMKITWKQPFTGQEVDLFADKRFEIKQEEPAVITNRIQQDISGTAAKLKIRVTGISINKPGTGDDKREAQIKVRIGKAEIKSGLTTYAISVDPSIDGDEQGYSIEFEIQGTLPRGESKVKGSISIPILAKAINPVNGKESEEISSTIMVNINYEPDRGGPRRRQ